VNNSVSRVAGLLAIAVFGVFLARTFDAHIGRALDHIHLSSEARAAVEKELPKMAGAELKSAALDPARRAAVQSAIDDAFIAGFRVVVLGSAVLALVAAGFGAAIRDKRRVSRS
jgi:hypothetical protein